MSADDKKLGPTGQFPDGKLNADDEGEIQLGVTHDADGLVRVNFGKPIAWLAMPKETAIMFAHMLLKHAGVKPQ